MPYFTEEEVRVSQFCQPAGVSPLPLDFFPKQGYNSHMTDEQRFYSQIENDIRIYLDGVTSDDNGKYLSDLFDINDLAQDIIDLVKENINNY